MTCKSLQTSSGRVCWGDPVPGLTRSDLIWDARSLWSPGIPITIPRHPPALIQRPPGVPPPLPGSVAPQSTCAW